MFAAPTPPSLRSSRCSCRFRPHRPASPRPGRRTQSAVRRQIGRRIAGGSCRAGSGRRRPRRQRGHTRPTHRPACSQEAGFGVEQVLSGVDLRPARTGPGGPIRAPERSRGVRKLRWRDQQPLPHRQVARPLDDGHPLVRGGEPNPVELPEYLGDQVRPSEVTGLQQQQVVAPSKGLHPGDRVRTEHFLANRAQRRRAGGRACPVGLRASPVGASVAPRGSTAAAHAKP